MKKNYPKKGQLFKSKYDFVAWYGQNGDRLIPKDSTVLLVNITEGNYSKVGSTYVFHFLLDEQIYRTEKINPSAWYHRFTYLNVNQS